MKLTDMRANHGSFCERGLPADNLFTFSLAWQQVEGFIHGRFTPPPPPTPPAHFQVCGATRDLASKLAANS